MKTETINSSPGANPYTGPQPRLYSADGYLVGGAVIVDHGESIQINGTLHPKGGLIITANCIESVAFGWFVNLT